SSWVSRFAKPVSMFTAGVNPASAVRTQWAANAGQSMLPDSVNGSRMAEMPVTFRRGRSMAIGSMVWPDMVNSKGQRLQCTYTDRHSPMPPDGSLPVMTHREALDVLAARRTDHVVVTTMGSAAIWPQLSDSPRDFHYLPSSMG